MGILTWILQFFSSSVITKVADYLTTRANDQASMHGMDTTAATSIVVEQLKAEVAARAASATISSQHSKLVSFIGGIFAFHVFMVILDSSFHLNWQVTALPAPMDTWEGYILLTLCGAVPVTNVANRLISKVWK